MNNCGPFTLLPEKCVYIHTHTLVVCLLKTKWVKNIETAKLQFGSMSAARIQVFGRFEFNEMCWFCCMDKFNTFPEDLEQIYKR